MTIVDPTYVGTVVATFIRIDAIDHVLVDLRASMK
jgi:hypothetical protein